MQAVAKCHPQYGLPVCTYKNARRITRRDANSQCSATIETTEQIRPAELSRHMLRGWVYLREWWYYGKMRGVSVVHRVIPMLQQTSTWRNHDRLTLCPYFTLSVSGRPTPYSGMQFRHRFHLPNQDLRILPPMETVKRTKVKRHHYCLLHLTTTPPCSCVILQAKVSVADIVGHSQKLARNPGPRASNSFIQVYFKRLFSAHTPPLRQTGRNRCRQ